MDAGRGANVLDFLTSYGRLELGDVLFGFDGRISRSTYWRAWVAWVLLSLLAVPVFILTSWIPYIAICFWVVALILMLNSYIAVSKKRLHDRGKSARWLLLFFLGPVVLEIVARSGGPLGYVCNVAASAISIWMIVELGCLAGAVGPNKYGPDPLAGL
jgi:uncharacterized membrane protein YhaH (DUF805 family)